jgi:hypothetical protein
VVGSARLSPDNIRSFGAGKPIVDLQLRATPTGMIFVGWVDHRVSCLQTDLVSAARYAESGEVSIAYQVFGDGPVELVFDRDGQCRCLLMAEFASYEREMENSARPETGEFATFLAGISDSALTFRNLDVLREEDL